MQPRKPLRRISAKRMKRLNGRGSLGFNSTIARKPCFTINSIGKYQKIDNADFPKPINKQSSKQKARLHKLAAVRARWWKEANKISSPLICGICDESINSFEELASDHIEPGHGKSDSETNLQPAHKVCNICKGSRRDFKIVRGDINWNLIHGPL